MIEDEITAAIILYSTASKRDGSRHVLGDDLRHWCRPRDDEVTHVIADRDHHLTVLLRGAGEIDRSRLTDPGDGATYAGLLCRDDPVEAAHPQRLTKRAGKRLRRRRVRLALLVVHRYARDRECVRHFWKRASSTNRSVDDGLGEPLQVIRQRLVSAGWLAHSVLLDPVKTWPWDSPAPPGWFDPNRSVDSASSHASIAPSPGGRADGGP